MVQSIHHQHVQIGLDLTSWLQHELLYLTSDITIDTHSAEHKRIYCTFQHKLKVFFINSISLGHWAFVLRIEMFKHVVVLVDRKMSICQNPREASGANDAVFTLTLCCSLYSAKKLYLNMWRLWQPLTDQASSVFCKYQTWFEHVVEWLIICVVKHWIRNCLRA